MPAAAYEQLENSILRIVDESGMIKATALIVEVMREVRGGSVEEGLKSSPDVIDVIDSLIKNGSIAEVEYCTSAFPSRIKSMIVSKNLELFKLNGQDLLKELAQVVG